MARTFNCGLGMILVVAPNQVDATVEALQEHGEPNVYQVGTVVPSSDSQPRVMVENMASAWH